MAAHSVYEDITGVKPTKQTTNQSAYPTFRQLPGVGETPLAPSTPQVQTNAQQVNANKVGVSGVTTPAPTKPTAPPPPTKPTITTPQPVTLGAQPAKPDEYTPAPTAKEEAERGKRATEMADKIKNHPVAKANPSDIGVHEVGKGDNNFLKGELTDANAKINASQKADDEAAKIERFRQFVANDGMTDEQKAKEEKKRKREQMWNSVSDGISALSNLYFTTKGAPARVINPRDGLTERAQERYDKMDAERKANSQQYLNWYMKQQAMKAANDQAAAELGYKKYNDDRNFALNAAKEDAKGKQWQQAFNQTERQNAAGNYFKGADLDLKKTAQRETASHNRVTEGQAAQRIGIARYNATKNGGGSGGSGGNGKGAYTIKLKDGKVYHYNKENTGALIGLGPTMIRKARAAAAKYAAAGTAAGKKKNTATASAMYARKNHYDNIANALEKAQSAQAIHAIVASNAWDFPSMDADVRNATGIGGGNSTGGARNVAPKQNKQIKVQKGW